jgi:hypothetical protein
LKDSGVTFDWMHNTFTLNHDFKPAAYDNNDSFDEDNDGDRTTCEGGSGSPREETVMTFSQDTFSEGTSTILETTEMTSRKRAYDFI